MPDKSLIQIHMIPEEMLKMGGAGSFSIQKVMLDFSSVFLVDVVVVEDSLESSADEDNDAKM